MGKIEESRRNSFYSILFLLFFISFFMIFSLSTGAQSKEVRSPGRAFLHMVFPDEVITKCGKRNYDE